MKSKIWEEFVSQSFPNFFPSGTKLGEIENVVENYIDNIPNMFSDVKELSGEKEEIKEKMLAYIDKQLETHCLNCFHDLEGNRRCPNCAWYNDLDDPPPADLTPITVKAYTFKDFSPKIAYPPIDKKHLQYLPDKLQMAVKTFIISPKKITKKDKDNIYHNLYNKNVKKFRKLYKKYKAKTKFAQFIQNTNFQ